MADQKRNYGNPPGDPRPAGEVTFNYCSHDGRFMLGTEPWLFETSWSPGGSHSAHIYNEPFTIRGVAIAEGALTIEQVSAEVIARSDFTSRNRTPQVGQCAILENRNGYFAVLQIVNIRYSNLPSENMMTLRYVIDTEGSTNFNRPDAVTSAAAATYTVLRAAEETKMALSLVRGGEPEEIAFGHNGPPPEYALTEEERQNAIAAVEIVATEIIQPVPDADRLRVAAQIIAKVAKAVGLWIASKTDVALDEFAKTIGKAAAVAIVGVFAAWVALHGKLSVLTHLLSGFAG